tara:strand:- start:93 stop:458 length:366 start_codon:yes stop_codon:yes gene_type:complete
METGTAIRFDADVDEETRTITISRQVWKYKPTAARGQFGNDGDWQRRTRPGKSGFRGRNRERVRATGEELAGMPLTADDAEEAFRVTSSQRMDYYTAQATTSLAEAAEHRDRASWPTQRRA